MSSKKNQLAKLMSLDNPQANAYLERFASEIYSAVEALPTNDEIIEQLELLESFIYKVPVVALRVIDFVISHPTPATPISTMFGELEGRHHEELVLKCVDMLGRIRYLESDGVLERLAPLLGSDDQIIANKAKSVLQSFAKFDLNLLMNSDLGYGPQAKALEFIRKWPTVVQLENLDFVEVILTEILRSSIEGTSLENPDSISVRFGAVQPNEFLKNLRREAMALIYELYSASSTGIEQMRLVKILQEAGRTPHLGRYGDEVAQMVQEDTKLVMDTYRKMLLDEHAGLAASAAVAKEVEKTLGFWERDKSLAEEAHSLRSAILSDRFYQLFRLLVGNDVDFDQNITWQEAEQKRTAQVEQIVDRLQPSDLGQWINDLNRIASQAQLVNGFEVRHFEYFLRSLGSRQFSIAMELLTDALEHDKPLALFTAHILDGLRRSGQLADWDFAVGQIARRANPRHISAVVWPLNINPSASPEREIRERDLLLLEDIVSWEGEFAFLAGCEEELPQLRAAIVNALVRIFRRDERRIERLLVKELSLHRGYASGQVSAIHAGILRGTIDCSAFTREGLAFLRDWLIDLPDLDWDAQEIMLNAAKDDSGVMLEVFRGRVDKRKSQEKTSPAAPRYTSVPFNLHPGLTGYVSEHPELKPKLVEWVDKISPHEAVETWEIGRLLSEIGAIGEIQLGLIEVGGDENLRKAVALVDPSTGGNLEMLMEIVRRTDDDAILGHVNGLLYATGVVMGEDGIACAWESKKQMVLPYLQDQDGRIRRFAERTIAGFDKDIERERIQVAERREIRRIEFEG